jgi:hypothetical protein
MLGDREMEGESDLIEESGTDKESKVNWRKKAKWRRKMKWKRAKWRKVVKWRKKYNLLRRGEIAEKLPDKFVRDIYKLSMITSNYECRRDVNLESGEHALMI